MGQRGVWSMAEKPLQVVFGDQWSRLILASDDHYTPLKALLTAHFSLWYRQAKAYFTPWSPKQSGVWFDFVQLRMM